MHARGELGRAMQHSASAAWPARWRLASALAGPAGPPASQTAEVAANRGARADAAVVVERRGVQLARCLHVVARGQQRLGGARVHKLWGGGGGRKGGAGRCRGRTKAPVLAALQAANGSVPEIQRAHRDRSMLRRLQKVNPQGGPRGTHLCRRRSRLWVAVAVADDGVHHRGRRLTPRAHAAWPRDLPPLQGRACRDAWAAQGSSASVGDLCACKHAACCPVQA